MKSPLVIVLKDFLKTYWKDSSPVLIGLSGGVDSSALFSSLLECRSFFDLHFHVVHFDHGWREESSLEASQLQEFVEKFSLPFHTERANFDIEYRSNLEDVARKQRFAFFRKIYKKVGAQSLVLAHQREDLAETVLKRLLEGAGILSLGGMEERSFYEDMEIWRPLLGTSRKDLSRWNARNSWIPFQDKTNEDRRFLRPRMRQELFPYLEQSFGKNVCHSLTRISREAALLKSSLERRLLPYLADQNEGSLGSYLPIWKIASLDLWEKQELVRLFLKKYKTGVSYSALKTVVTLLESAAIGKKIDASHGELWVEGGGLFWWKDPTPVFQGIHPIPRSSTSIREGDWVWHVEKTMQPLCRKEALSFFLSGAISYKADEACAVVSYDSLSLKDREKVSRYLSKNKVPSRLKKMFPYIINENGFVSCSFCFDYDLKCNDSSGFLNIILKKSCELKDNIFPFCYASDERG
jgi:tRNA(Ile)-lysidine synthase